MQTDINTVDDYIQTFPDDVQARLKTLRLIIKENAPGAAESIAYKMPAYKTGGKPLVYFAGYKNHIGLYATPTGHSEFVTELSGYKQGKGSVQFPNTEPLPIELIKKIVKFRVQENQMKNK